MTGPAGEQHPADARHLRICREAVWGECPASPEWTCLPLAGEGLHMGAVDVLFTPGTFFGGHAAPFQLSEGQRVTGRLEARLWPEAAGLLLGAALERSDGEMPSHCLDWYAPSGSRRFLGVMVDRLELAARGESGECMLALELIGRSEEGNPALGSVDFDYAGLSPVPLLFRDAAIGIEGTALTGVEQFRLEVSNALETGPLRQGRVAFIAPGKRVVRIEIIEPASGDYLEEAVRNGQELSFSATLGHPAGHTMSLALPRLRVESAAPLVRPGELAREAVRFAAAADEAGDEITWNVYLA
jgi:hypothetical protein